jgi:drug/metabolite transporter (DMT)-like permease
VLLILKNPPLLITPSITNFNFVPVFSMIIALLTGQALNIWQLVGTVLVMLGVMSSGGFCKKIF